MNLAEAAGAIGGELVGTDGAFVGVSTDTRTLVTGELFFALRGPRFDAHEMLPDAEAAGAAGAVVERPGEGTLSRILTSDARESLGRLAGAWRARFDLPVLAVTGSAGKTTVKEMLASILREQGRVLATRGNLNNDIGVPLTLFGLDAGHEALVVEMGANRAGDIALLCGMAKPDIGVITLCAPAHLEGFGSIENVARAKGEIISALGPDGVAVINAEDRFAPLWRSLAGQRRIVTFGAGGEVYADAREAGAGGSRFRLHVGGTAVTVNLGYRGEHNVLNACAAAAAALAAGVAPAAIASGLAAATTVPGRLQMRACGAALRLLDDTYNANPASLNAALAVLAEEAGPRWLVLGDMGELGEDRERYHRDAAAAAFSAGVERLFTTGALARFAADAFPGDASHASDLESLTAAVRDALAAETGERPVTILVKGSRIMQLDRVVAALAGSEGPAC